ncbi:MAG: tryptophan--tRNA ligase [Clostridia bacterium]|nr:tryptophan--tRNA ligase [Clostridia bacterium]
MNNIILTGIKPTGKLHFGNYFGAIKPGIELVDKLGGQAFFFIADYHALNTIKDKNLFKEYTYDAAATWLACGLDQKDVIFYRQSDVPEIFELNWILSNITPKGLMNRAHAYKSSVDENIKNNDEPDSGINMGLYNYPILMAADILTMQTKFVPVGEDQKQHVEIARELARIFNNSFEECLTLPEVVIKEGVGTIPGLDGRKMSKSYNNTIVLFADENTLKKQISRIITDSSEPDAPKSTDCFLFKIFELFANKNQIEDMKKRFAKGISWGEVKKEVFEVANTYLKPMREKYNYYLTHREKVDQILQQGAEKAQKIAKQTLNKVRKSIGKS